MHTRLRRYDGGKLKTRKYRVRKSSIKNSYTQQEIVVMFLRQQQKI